MRFAPRATLAKRVLVASDSFDITERRERVGGSDSARRRNVSYEILRSPNTTRRGRIRAHPEVLKFLRAVSAPTRLRDVVAAPHHPQVQQTVAKLILDGIVKVKIGREFLGGGAAFVRLFDCETAPKPTGLAEQLSVQAAEYGEQLLPRAVGELASQLYRYNSIPAGSRWVSRLPSHAATRDYLGIDAPEILRAARVNTWGISIDPTDRFPWFGWMPRAETVLAAPDAAPGRTPEPRPVFKLYISVRPDHARAALLAAAPDVFGSRAFALKIGAGAHGVLRPDKMVAYFWSFDDLADTAATLDRRLGGLTAHGVPFTASIGSSGLLSWGIDPPAVSNQDSMTRSSWRFHIAGRLAVALASAADVASAELSASRFALARLQLDGIDLVDPDPMAALDALIPLRRPRS